MSATAVDRPATAARKVAPPPQPALRRRSVPPPAGPLPAEQLRRRRLVLIALLVTGSLGLLVVASDGLQTPVVPAGDLRWGWLPLLLTAQFVSMAAPAVGTVVLVRSAGTRLRHRDVLPLTYASNALSVSLPLAGPEVAAAHTYRQLVRLGAQPATVVWALLMSGLAATTTFAALALAGVASTGSDRALVAAGGAGALAVIPIAGVLLGLRRPAARLFLEANGLRLWQAVRWARRQPSAEPTACWQGFLDRVAQHRLSVREAAVVLSLAALNWLADMACLALAVIAVDRPVPWQGLLLAYAAATAAGSLRLTPGGLGVVETALTAGLVTAGLDLPHAVAAALLYRLVSYWLVVLAGWLALLAAQARRPGPGRPRSRRQTVVRDGAHVRHGQRSAWPDEDRRLEPIDAGGDRP